MTPLAEYNYVCLCCHIICVTKCKIQEAHNIKD